MIRNTDIANEISFLEDSLQRVNSELIKLRKRVPEGAGLRAARHGNVYQYFMKVQGSGTNGIYIKKKNRERAIVLAQIEYDEKLITILRNAIGNLNTMKNTWVENPFIYAADRMIPAKRELVRMPYKSDEQYLSEWINQEYERMEFRDGFPEYYTRQGLRVRSKSEVIIADILDEMGVPFLYEKPIQLGMGTVHPDFTLLDIGERKEVYWEHFGMMDDMDYRNNAILKIRKYESNGLYQYDSVIWSFETGSNPLNTRETRKMIKRLKKKLGY